MNAAALVLGWNDWLSLFAHYLMLSMLSVGGPIATTPEMHRFLVDERHWLSVSQFNDSIALAQAAPGPNMLFVALMGWHIGMNTGSTAAAFGAVALTLAGILLPSSMLMMATAQWGHRNRHLPAVRAFRQGMAPLVIAMLLATAWLLGSSAGSGAGRAPGGIGRAIDGLGAGGAGGAAWPFWLISMVSGLLLWRTRIHLLWMLAAGAALGWLLSM